MSVAFKVYAAMLASVELSASRAADIHTVSRVLNCTELHWTCLTDIPRVKVRDNNNKNVIISNLSHFNKLCPTIFPILSSP